MLYLFTYLVVGFVLNYRARVQTTECSGWTDYTSCFACSHGWYTATSQLVLVQHRKVLSNNYVSCFMQHQPLSSSIPFVMHTIHSSQSPSVDRSNR